MSLDFKTDRLSNTRRANAHQTAQCQTMKNLADNRLSTIAQRKLAGAIQKTHLRVAQFKRAKNDGEVRQVGLSVVQMRRFKDGAEAKSWLIGRFLNPELALPVDDGEYAFFEAELNKDEQLRNDLAGNVSTLYGVWDEVKEQVTSDRALAGKAPQRTLTQAQKDHILRGECNGESITGGHCGPSCIANGFTITDKRLLAGGFYKATLNKTVKIKNKDKVLQKESTFYPDNWSETDIITAIQYAEQPIKTKPVLIITTPKGTGTNLFINADSCFPYFGS